MTATTNTAAPLAYAVLFRPHRPRARWRTVAIVRDEFAALAASTGRGDWTTRPLWTAEELAEATAAVARANAPDSRQGARQSANGAANVPQANGRREAATAHPRAIAAVSRS